MKLKLTDGMTIEAEKDCMCQDHDGPHWLYMNDLWRASNERLRAIGNIRGYIVAEIPRLAEKRHEMTSRGITEILRNS
jgi:2C-methyl-D-erythritol 2,4-cyclodiphosphate synthase